MDRYEKSAEQIMKRGDMIIAEQKRRTAFIKRTAYAVSGLCAVALIGTGIGHNRDLFSAPDRKAHDDFSVITETTETTAEKSVVPKIRPKVASIAMLCPWVILGIEPEINIFSFMSISLSTVFPSK